MKPLAAEQRLLSLLQAKREIREGRRPSIMPFSTHGGGGKGHRDRDIAKLCPGAQVMEMYTAYEGEGDAAEKEISGWIQKNNLNERKR